MIKEIAYSGFRKGTGHLQFGAGINLIQGPNESGKSTVAEAIAVTFCGVDANGSKGPDHLITEGQNEFNTTVVTTKSTLRRKKKRGATSVLEIETGAGVVKPTQTEFQKMLRLSASAWLATWKTGYFTSLSPKEQMAVISELQPIDGMKILSDSGIIDAVKAHCPNVLKAVTLVNCKREAELIAGERRAQQNIRSHKEGEVKALEEQITTIQKATNAEQIDVESYEGMLNELRADLASIDSYENAVANYNTANTRYQEKTKALENKRKELETVKGLKTTQDVSDEEIAKFMADMKDAKATIDQLVLAKKPLPAMPHKGKMPDTHECPTCLRPIDNADRTLFIKHQNDAFDKYNQEAREVADYNKELDEKIKKFQDIGNGLRKKYDDAMLSKKQAEENKKKQEQQTKLIETDISVLEKFVNENKPAAPTQPAIMETKTKDGLRKEIEETFAQITSMKQGETGASDLRKKIEILQKEIEDLGTVIEVLDSLEKAVKDMPITKTKMILDNLHIDGLQLSIEGDDFIIKDEKGVPYPSLSAGRKIKTSIKFCVKLRSLAGAKAPPWLFVDDADLMDQWQDLVPGNLQTFVAKVDSSIDDVMVVQL